MRTRHYSPACQGWQANLSGRQTQDSGRGEAFRPFLIQWLTRSSWKASESFLKGGVRSPASRGGAKLEVVPRVGESGQRAPTSLESSVGQKLLNDTKPRWSIGAQPARTVRCAGDL